MIATLTTLIGTNKVNEARYQWGVDNEFATSYGTAPQVVVGNLVTYGQLRPHPYLR